MSVTSLTMKFVPYASVLISARLPVDFAAGANVGAWRVCAQSIVGVGEADAVGVPLGIDEIVDVGREDGDAGADVLGEAVTAATGRWLVEQAQRVAARIAHPHNFFT